MINAHSVSIASIRMEIKSIQNEIFMSSIETGSVPVELINELRDARARLEMLESSTELFFN